MANADRLILIYDEAAARPPGPERDRFVAESSGDDVEMREKIASLLRSLQSLGNFLQEPIFPPSARTIEIPGEAIGPYKLLEKLGEGGCGVVYVAEQTEPVRRRVALKVIKVGMDTKQVISRFEAERQALAMMDHPNIAKVLDAGSTGTGRPYFVMELVRGVRITDYCDENEVGTRERLNLFTKVCRAIQHAHQKSVIHRDIKPSNILVTLHDGVPVPKVIDFGLAKAIEGRLTGATIHTQFLQFVGTPAYMSPEQAQMSGIDIDTRSDIYSLGVLLYELLTGQPPFDGEKLIASGIDAMRKTIREIEPARPSTRLVQKRATDAKRRIVKSQSSSFRPPIDSDLDWIVMKCLEKDRSRRYETANDLATDVDRHLKDETVMARRPSRMYQFRKAWRRNKLAFSSTAAVCVALLLGTVMSTWQAFEARRARESERRSRLAVEAARREADLKTISAEKDRYVALLNLADAAWQQENFQLLQQTLEETRLSPERNFEWYYWQRQAHLHVRTFRGHLDDALSVAFSPDGARLATGSADQTARIWNVATGEEVLRLIGHTNGVSCISFSPDGRCVATGSSDHTARVWDAATGRELFQLKGHRGPVNSIAFSRDGNRIVTGSSDSTACVWDVTTGRVLVTLAGHTKGINAVAFSPDGRLIVTGSHDHTAKVWNVATGEGLYDLKGHGSEVYAAVFSPDGRTIVTGAIEPIARVWDTATGQELPARGLHGRGTMTALAFSPDGEQILTGSWTSIATLWDAATSGEKMTVRGHAGGVRGVAFSPDGQRIVTASAEVKLWEARRHREPLTLQGHLSNVLAVAFSVDGHRIVTATGFFNVDGTAGGTGAAQVWDSANGKILLTLTNHTTGVSSVAFSRDGARIITGSGDHTARVWDSATGSELLKLTGRGAISSVAISPDAQRIVTGSHDHTATIWNATAGRRIFELVEHSAPVSSVAVSPDGRWIISGSFDQTVVLWNEATGTKVRTFHAPMRRIYCVAFSPDGQRIIAGGWNSMAIVWEVATGRELFRLIGHNGPVNSVTFSPGGERILTGSFDYTAKLWDAARGRQLLTLRHSLPVSSAAFSPDSQRIVTGSWDHTAKVWQAARVDQVTAWAEEEQVTKNSRP